LSVYTSQFFESLFSYFSTLKIVKEDKENTFFPFFKPVSSIICSLCSIINDLINDRKSVCYSSNDYDNNEKVTVDSYNQSIFLLLTCLFRSLSNKYFPYFIPSNCEDNSNEESEINTTFTVIINCLLNAGFYYYSFGILPEIKLFDIDENFHKISTFYHDYSVVNSLF
jgi:hypothetical protein